MLEFDRDVAVGHGALRHFTVARESGRVGRLLAEPEHTAGLLVTCATYEHVRQQRASDVA
jgi:hypothetical protein